MGDVEVWLKTQTIRRAKLVEARVGGTDGDFAYLKNGPNATDRISYLNNTEVITILDRDNVPNAAP